MLKMIGILLVLTGAAGIGASMNRGFRQHYRQLMRLKELLLLIGNELRCLRMPLPQAIRRIAGRVEEPFRDTLLQMSEQLSGYEEADPEKVWRSILQKNRGKYLFNEEEFQIFLDAGAVFGQENGYMQGEEVDLYVEQIGFRVVHTRSELETKQRLCRYLCGAGGLFLILILV